jgi:hypothetical protein
MYWQKVPLSWREAPAAIALAKALHERDARVYLLDLWEWAAQHGSTHPSDIALHAFARAAFYDGDEQFFFDALRKTGWLSEADGNVAILSWADVVASLHVSSGLSADDIKRKQAAERSKRYRDRHAASRSVTQRHAPSRSRHADDRDAHRDAHRDDASQIVTIQHETSTIESVTQPSRDRHASRTEREKERDINTKNLALFASAPSAAVGEVISPPRRGRPPKAKVEGDEPSCTEDRERWLAQVRILTGLTESELIPSKNSNIRFAQQRKLRGMDQLMRALEGLQNDPFAKTAGLGYLLSDDGITKGLAKWKKEAGTTHISRQYGEIDPELGF